LSRPSYLPGLEPNGFYLFSHPKELFHDDNEIKQAPTVVILPLSAGSYLDSMPSEFHLTGISELFDWRNLCIAVKGDCVEKYTRNFA